MRKIQNAIIKPLLVLIIISTFLFTGFSALASSDTGSDTDILTVDNYFIIGDILHVTVSDKNSGITYEIELNLRDHINETDEYLTLQATDNNGNISNSIQFKNPFFSPDAVTQSNTSAPIHNNTNPFTPEGTGTVIDNATEEDGKEFYSITTENGNIFYLIVDRQRNSNNIYLLNAVTERDLLPFVSSHEDTFNPVPQPPVITEPEPEQTPEPAPEPEPSESNIGMIILIVLIIGGVIGAAYYIKVVKPKKEAFDDDFGTEDFISETDDHIDTDDQIDTEDIDFNVDEDEEYDPNI